MAEIRKGISWASLTALLIGIGLIVYLAWSATHKTDTENYSRGATHNESTVNITPNQHAYPLCCAKFIIQPDGSYVDAMKKFKDDKKKEVKK